MEAEEQGIVSVREAKAFDLRFLAEAEAAVFSDPYSEKLLREHLSGTYNLSFVATAKGRPVGYLLCQCLPPESEVFRVAVLPDSRRCGIGRLMMAAYFRAGARRGCDSFFLEVRAGNTAACRLYESLGYREIARRKHYYRSPVEDAVVYRLSRREETEK